jgi:hypothetical protein
LNELVAGSRLWCWVIGGLVVAGVYSGQQEALAARLHEHLLSTAPEPEAHAAYSWAVACLGLAHVLSGARWQAQAVVERLWKMVASGVEPGWANYIQAFTHHRFEARPWQAFQQAEQGMRNFQALGMERDALILQTLSGMALGALGDVHGGAERMRGVLIASQQWGAHLAHGAAHNFMCQMLADSREPEHRREAQEQARGWLKGAENAYSYRQGTVHAVLAKVMTDDGAPHEAEPHAREACGFLATHRVESIHGRTYLSVTLRAQGRHAEARQEAELAVEQLKQMGNAGVYAVATHLALAEACFAQADTVAAEAALREALQCVRDRARDIPDPAAREHFLTHVPENARTLALARERWGELPA